MLQFAHDNNPSTSTLNVTFLVCAVTCYPCSLCRMCFNPECCDDVSTASGLLDLNDDCWNQMWATGEEEPWWFLGRRGAAPEFYAPGSAGVGRCSCTVCNRLRCCSLFCQCRELVQAAEASNAGQQFRTPTSASSPAQRGKRHAAETGAAATGQMSPPVQAKLQVVCAYCSRKTRSWRKCTCCEAVLHTANGHCDWPCFSRFHSPEHADHCWAACKARRIGRAAFESGLQDPDCKQIVTAERRRSEKKGGPAATPAARQGTKRQRHCGGGI